MNFVMFVCFMLVWLFTAVQYWTYRDEIGGRAFMAFTSFMVSTILFIVGGSAWIAEVAG